jgi:hypothetical protein
MRAISFNESKIASMLSSTGRTKQAESWPIGVPAFISVGELGRNIEADKCVEKGLLPPDRGRSIPEVSLGLGDAMGHAAEHPLGRLDDLPTRVPPEVADP